jgi:hypothetical protein
VYCSIGGTEGEVRGRTRGEEGLREKDKDRERERPRERGEERERYINNWRGKISGHSEHSPETVLPATANKKANN